MIITIATQKGGVSKTTTAATIAQALSFKGKKTLLIDSDSQRSATNRYGAEGKSGGTYSLILGKEAPENLIEETEAGSIIPSSELLDCLGEELKEYKDRDYFLKTSIEPIRNKYDYIIIDTPPGFNTCLVQALTAADLVIIPLLCDSDAPEALFQVYRTINEVRKRCNPGLKVGAVVLTQCRGNAILTRQYEELLADQCEKMKLPLAKTKIRYAIAIQEAQSLRKSIYAHKPKCNPAIDYLTLCEEIGLLKKTRKER